MKKEEITVEDFEKARKALEKGNVGLEKYLRHWWKNLSTEDKEKVRKWVNNLMKEDVKP